MPARHSPVLMSMQPVQDWQVPVTHVEPLTQDVQRLPPLPQREGVVAVMQTPAAVQQPEGQVLGLQVEPPPPPVAPPPPPVLPTHWPALQLVLPAQSWQLSPFRPHVALLVPV